MNFPRTKTIPVLGYAECERVTATERSPIHVRRLSQTGLHPNGGADTEALCGAEVAWDISQTSLDEIMRRIESRTGEETWRYCSPCAEYVRVLVGEVQS